MIQKFWDYCNKHNLIKENDNIVLGVSGGADSICLLFLLQQLREEKNLSLAVVHVNHMMREKAKEEALYVKKICAQYNIPFFLFEKNITLLSNNLHITTEEAGRMTRYEVFHQVLQQHFQGNGNIAVAHNQNDNAETILFHLFRGTGLKGLSGIPRKRSIFKNQKNQNEQLLSQNIIRPLLAVSRSEIEQYLTKNEIKFYQDETNDQDIYTRNKIRHHILPYANDHICQEATAHICRLGIVLEETQDFLETVIKDAYDRCIIQENNTNQENNMIKIDLSKFQILHSYIKKSVIKKCVDELTDGGKDITSTHINDILSLEQKQVQKKIMLPYDLLSIRGYDTITIQKNEVLKQVRVEKQQQDKDLVEYKIFDYDINKSIPQKTYTKWFDYDKIDKSLQLRNRKQGDYLTINQQFSRKLLKDYFINEKINQEERDHILLLANDNHILWVIGYRMSEYYKVTKKTKRILQVQFLGGIEDD